MTVPNELLYNNDTDTVTELIFSFPHLIGCNESTYPHYSSCIRWQIFSANLGLYLGKFAFARVFCFYFFKDDCISVRVKPFVSGRSKYAYTKKMKLIAANHRKFASIPYNSAIGKNEPAHMTEMTELANIAIQPPIDLN